MLHVFISYRRADSIAAATLIRKSLLAEFGASQAEVFMDIDSIQPGVDFVDVLEDNLNQCNAFIALIGKQWLSVTDEAGNRRLDDPDDFTRMEIASALKRDILVIPVLVDGATMPDPEDLPKPLAKLARRNALTISYERFDHDMGKLVRTLKGVDDSAVKSPASKQETPKPAKPKTASSSASTPAKPAPAPVKKEPAQQPYVPPVVTAPKPVQSPVRVEAAPVKSSVNTDRLFLLYPGNAAFIRGETRNLATGKGSEIVVAIVVGVLIYGPMLYFASNSRANPSPESTLGLIVVGLIPIALLWFGLAGYRAEKRLIREGNLCDGTITSSKETPEKSSNSSAIKYNLDLAFRFQLPAGQSMTGTQSHTMDKPLGANLPAAGTPIKVLYRNEKDFTVL